MNSKSLTELKKNKSLSTAFTIIAFDIETYKCSETKLELPFAVGIYVPRNKVRKVFFINKDESGGATSYQFMSRVFK